MGGTCQARQQRHVQWRDKESHPWDVLCAAAATAASTSATEGCLIARQRSHQAATSSQALTDGRVEERPLEHLDERGAGVDDLQWAEWEQAGRQAVVSGAQGGDFLAGRGRRRRRLQQQQQ